MNTSFNDLVIKKDSRSNGSGNYDFGMSPDQLDRLHTILCLAECDKRFIMCDYVGDITILVEKISGSLDSNDDVRTANYSVNKLD